MEHSELLDEQRLARRLASTRLLEIIERSGDGYDVTPETTTNLEVVTELARQAIEPYTPWRGRIDEVRAAGWYNVR
jgi:hypothetical protein